MEQKRLVPQYQQLAKQLIRISQSLNEIYLDQLAIVGNLTAQNMFKIYHEQHSVHLINSLFNVHFHLPCTIHVHQKKTTCKLSCT